MRRDEKAVTDRAALDGIIQGSDFCHLACCLDEVPYLIPLSFGYDGQAVYLHTATDGKKIRIFESNPRVCLAFVAQSELIRDEDRACKWSMGFSSVLAEGRISEISDPDQKIAALQAIMAHYSDRAWEISPADLSGTRIWKIPLEVITGKQSPPAPR